MNPLPEAVPPDAVPVYAVDGAGEPAEQLGTGTRAADGVVLVEGRLAARLAADAWTPLRVAVPAPAGRDGGVALVDVGTVHVADPEKATWFHGPAAAEPGSAVVALELVGGPDAGPATRPAVLRTANVLCLLFGHLLRVCRP